MNKSHIMVDFAQIRRCIVKILLIFSLFVSVPVWAFGGGGGGRIHKWYSRGVDAIGIHYGGSGQVDIKFTCDDPNATPSEQGVCECNEGYEYFNTACVVVCPEGQVRQADGTCKDSCPTERQCGDICCGDGDFCVDGNRCCDVSIYETYGQCCPYDSNIDGFGTPTDDNGTLVCCSNGYQWDEISTSYYTYNPICGCPYDSNIDGFGTPTDDNGTTICCSNGYQWDEMNSGYSILNPACGGCLEGETCTLANHDTGICYHGHCNPPFCPIATGSYYTSNPVSADECSACTDAVFDESTSLCFACPEAGQNLSWPSDASCHACGAMFDFVKMTCSPECPEGTIKLNNVCFECPTATGQYYSSLIHNEDDCSACPNTVFDGSTGYCFACPEAGQSLSWPAIDSCTACGGTYEGTEGSGNCHK